MDIKIHQICCLLVILHILTGCTSREKSHPRFIDNLSSFKKNIVIKKDTSKSVYSSLKKEESIRIGEILRKNGITYNISDYYTWYILVEKQDENKAMHFLFGDELKEYNIKKPNEWTEVYQCSNFLDKDEFLGKIQKLTAQNISTQIYVCILWETRVADSDYERAMKFLQKSNVKITSFTGMYECIKEYRYDDRNNINNSRHHHNIISKDEGW